MHAGLLKGKLDQQGQCLHVEEAFTRDVAPGELQEVGGKLGDWCAVGGVGKGWSVGGRERLEGEGVGRGRFASVRITGERGREDLEGEIKLLACLEKLLL
jgi:hypothetical protein